MHCQPLIPHTKDNTLRLRTTLKSPTIFYWISFQLFCKKAHPGEKGMKIRKFDNSGLANKYLIVSPFGLTSMTKIFRTLPSRFAWNKFLLYFKLHFNSLLRDFIYRKQRLFICTQNPRKVCYARVSCFTAGVFVLFHFFWTKFLGDIHWRIINCLPSIKDHFLIMFLGEVDKIRLAPLSHSLWTFCKY